MNKIFTYTTHWVLFRIYIWLKIFRPKNVVIRGRVKMNWRTVIIIDRASQITIDSGADIRNTVIRLVHSSLSMNASARLHHCRLQFAHSSMHAGKVLQLEHVMLNLSKESRITTGDYFKLCGKGNDRLRFFIAGSGVEAGDNVNINAEIFCHGAVLQIGNNVFLNAGTQIRCRNRISFGNNIMVSYDCLIFDTNTHSIHAADRYKEMTDGYPNEAVQDEVSRQKVKTAPIRIGHDNWIGTRAIILKGTTLGNEVIVGAAAVVSGVEVPDGKTIYGNPGRIK